MGIVPLQYQTGETAASLGLTGKEKFDIELPTELTPGTKENKKLESYCKGQRVENFVTFYTDASNSNSRRYNSGHDGWCLACIGNTSN